MSQRMEFDEAQSQSNEGYQSGYRDSFTGTYGQKLDSTIPTSRIATPGQRLALAIVSLCLLIPLSGIVLGIMHLFGGFGLFAGLIGLGMICVTIIAVNFVFNYRH